MMAYDPIRDRVVLFGGVLASGTNLLYGTWEWDSQNWDIVHDTTGSDDPVSRASASMVFNSKTGKVVMYGGSSKFQGFSSQNGLDETWTWDGENWAQIDSPGPEVPRLDGMMAYDTNRDQIILFGGHRGGFTPPFFGDTWALNMSTNSVSNWLMFQ